MWVMSEIRKRPRHTGHDREMETSARTSKLVRAMTVKKEEKNAQMNESMFMWTGKSEWHATIIIHACTYG